MIREGKGERLKEFGDLLGPLSEFKQRGKSGLRINDAIPNIAQRA